MPHPLEAGTIRILEPDGSTAGTGFLVSKRLAVTCAHVVESVKAKPGDVLKIQYHIGNGISEGKVLKDGWSKTDDIAFLLLGSSIGKAVPVDYAASSNGHNFLALGYPEGSDVDVRWSQGKIGGLVKVDGYTHELIQIQGSEIDRGLSGAPIWDVETQSVVGMVTGYGDIPRSAGASQLRFGYATSVDTIHAAYPKFILASQKNKRRKIFYTTWTLAPLAILLFVTSKLLLGAYSPSSVCKESVPLTPGVRAIVAQDDRGDTRWWVGTSEKGAETFLESRENSFFYNKDELGSETVLAIHVDPKNASVWIGTSGSGLVLLEQSEDMTDSRPYTLSDHFTRTGKDGLPGCRISAILQSEGGNLYVGAHEGAGLGISRDGSSWNTVAPPESWNNKMPFSIYSLAEDKTGAIWVGTIQGLYRYHESAWSNVYVPPSISTPSLWVRALALTPSGDLLIGTEKDGIFSLDPTRVADPWDGKITIANGLSDNNILSLEVIPIEESILVGTNDGLSICSQRGGNGQGLRANWECWLVNQEEILNKPILSIGVSANGQEAMIGINNGDPVVLPASAWQNSLPR